MKLLETIISMISRRAGFEPPEPPPREIKTYEIDVLVKTFWRAERPPTNQQVQDALESPDCCDLMSMTVVAGPTEVNMKRFS